MHGGAVWFIKCVVSFFGLWFRIFKVPCTSRGVNPPHGSQFTYNWPLAGATSCSADDTLTILVIRRILYDACHTCSSRMLT